MDQNELKHEMSGNGNEQPQAKKSTDDQLVELTADEKRDIAVEFDTLGKHDPDKLLGSKSLKTNPASSVEVVGSRADGKKIQNAGDEILKGNAKHEYRKHRRYVTDNVKDEDLPSLRQDKYPGDSEQERRLPERNDTSDCEPEITDKTKINNEDGELNDSTKQNTGVNAAKSDPIQSFSDEFNTRTDAANADSENKDVDTDGFHVQQGQESSIVDKQCTPTVSSTNGLCDSIMDSDRDTKDEDRTNSIAGQLGGADKDVLYQSVDEGMNFEGMDKPGKIDQLESERVTRNNIQVPISNRPQSSKQHG